MTYTPTDVRLPGRAETGKESARRASSLLNQANEEAANID